MGRTQEGHGSGWSSHLARHRIFASCPPFAAYQPAESMVDAAAPWHGDQARTGR